MESWWIDQSLHPAGARPRNIHLNPADLAVFVCFHWCEKWIGDVHCRLLLT